MHDRPKARTDQLISERIDDELVIFDQHNHVAHCLSHDAVRVWEHCDGRLTQTDIARRLTLSLDVVQRAIAALDERGLLDDGPVAAPGYSRRQAAIRLARIGGAALAAPLVYSVDVGTAAAKASHLAAGCTLTSCGSCNSTTGCTLCAVPGLTSTNSMCASGICYCSVVNSSGAPQTVLRCAIGSSCLADAVPCVTSSQCCGNNCVGACRPASPTC